MPTFSGHSVRTLAVVSAALSLGACATVTRGGNDAWVVNSEPTGAKVETSNGHQCPATPCAIKMSRKSEFVATISKPGYKTATVTVTHKTAGAGAAGVAGNVLVGGVIGLGVDMYTGASQDLVPNPVMVTLEPETAPD
ncbi:MAG: PEGA domain-containing protein [Caulobacter sp.]|nr:PEGA domain-containing protein [Caulobacter sp.]